MQEKTYTVPQDLEAEAACIGSMMLSAHAVDSVREVLPTIDSEWFIGPHYQQAFEILIDLHESGRPIDLVLFSDEARKRGVYHDLGEDVGVVQTFIYSVGSHVNAKYYAEIVREKAILRQIMKTNTEAWKRCQSPDASPEEIARLTEDAILRIQRQHKRGPVALGSLIDDVLKGIEGGGADLGLHTGFTWFDWKIGGMLPGQMIVVAARPSVGKTAWAMSAALTVAIDQASPVGVFSLEMSARELAARAVKMRPEAAEAIRNSRIIIDDNSPLSTSDMLRTAQRMKDMHKVRCIIVDYIGLVQDKRGAKESKQVEVANVSRCLKTMAKKLEVPVIALCQLNRQVIHRTTMPELSDLRDSGAIEQDADIVLMLHRDKSPVASEKTEDIWFLIRKHRNGPLGNEPYTFVKERMTFREKVNGRVVEHIGAS